MPILAEWSDERQQILLHRYQGAWAQAQYKQGNIDAITLLDQGSGPVVMIAIIEQGSHLEGGIFSLTEAMRGSTLDHPRVKGVITVNLPPALKVLGQLYNGVLAPRGEEVRMMSDLDSALVEAETILLRLNNSGSN